MTTMINCNLPSITTRLLRTFGWITVLSVLMLLSACRTELFSQLNERDANDMLTVLRRTGLEVDKSLSNGGKGWSIFVDDKHVVQAMTVLRENGLPKVNHTSLGDLFRKDSMVSSPTEDRVRFLHGVSQELSETLTRIDGVVSARVHIVLPENDPRVRNATPSSAAVFIKHHPLVNIDTLVPPIRQLVARSIEGLELDRVSVTLVPAQIFVEAPAKEGGLSLIWFGLFGLAALGGAGGGAWWWWRRQSLAKENISAPQTSEPAPQA